MKVEDVRLENLRALVVERSTIAAVAQVSDTSPAYLSHILNGVPLPSGRPRGVGHTLARKLEQGCGKPTGWMDRPHPICADGRELKIEARSMEELAHILAELEAETFLNLIRETLILRDKNA
ncbi:hypothetical protein [Chromobacterium haemolyticum]|uniref:hypothetical protein n=1 Tax=Chromobacterium haemolyticum TaxID=394935 RepID=UPI001130662D|nr:hypothetical protein [Chromobacterium haemolyticum]